MVTSNHWPEPEARFFGLKNDTIHDGSRSVAIYFMNRGFEPKIVKTLEGTWEAFWNLGAIREIYCEKPDESSAL